MTDKNMSRYIVEFKIDNGQIMHETVEAVSDVAAADFVRAKWAFPVIVAVADMPA